MKLQEASMTAIVAEIRAGLAANPCPANAAAMQRYMKTDMAFHGLGAPVVRTVLQEAVKRHPIRDREALEDAVRELIAGATHREEWYIAAGLLKRPASLKLLTPDSLDLIAWIATTTAWWDVVDNLTKPIGSLLVAHREQVEPVIRSWIDSDDLWLRRLAIICQLGLRERTDLALLTDAIEAAADEQEFFLRKAIGWGLREYSKTDEAWVRAFVDTHSGLSPLSKREALKWLDRRAGG